MEGHTIDEAAVLLEQSADYLRNKILFSGQAHPILKPCVFFPEPMSLRIMNIDGKINEYGVKYTKKTVSLPASNGRSYPFAYDFVNMSGLFELTFFPEHFDMSEAKESGRIQLYRAKAVFADRLAEFSIDMAVGWMMHNWQHFNDLKNRWEPETQQDEVSKTKSHVRGKIGECVILTQNGIHYLVDSPVSIPLSDIRITDWMLTEYAASEGITIMKNQTKTPPAKVKEPSPPVKTFTQEEVAAILKTDPDSVFKRMTGNHAVTIYPSIFIKTPLMMRRTVYTGGNPDDFGRGATNTISVEEGLSGVFGITGCRPLQWDEIGLAQITFGGSSGVILTQGDYTYRLKSPLKIRRDELIVTEDDLLQYRRETEGNNFNDPPAQELTAEPTPSQLIKLPIIGGEEVIPIRLIPLITEPEIPPKQLLDCLYNPRGDFLKHLNHCPFSNDWTLIYKELETFAMSGKGKQLEQFPKGTYVTKSDFEGYEYVVSKTIRLKLNRAIPDTLLILAFEGFDASPATPRSLPEQKAQKDTRQAKEKKEAATTDLSEKMAELKKGKIKANSEAVDKFLTAYHQATGKKAGDHNDLLRHMRENPKVYQLVGFSKDEADDRFIWIIPRPKALAAERDYYSKKQIVRKIKDRMKCIENSAEETPPTITA